MVLFSYGPDRQRYRQVSEGNDGSRLEVIYLAGGTFKETRLLESPGSVRVRQDMQIAGAVQFRRSFTLTNGIESNITTSTHYVHADALGSVDAVTDQNGNLVSANAYSPFGMRRDADWSSLSMLPTLSLPEMFDRVMDNGFTQHEMLDDTGLIHMGGRLYDPVLGRFMSADPFVQAPQNSQSFNRYSYVWNNPFKYVDPTGYILVPMESWDMRGISIGNAWSFDINNNITNHINNSGLSNIQWLESNNGSSSNTGTVAARPASASPSPPPSPPPPSLSVETGRMISATSGAVGGSGTVSASNSLGDVVPISNASLGGSITNSDVRNMAGVVGQEVCQIPFVCAAASALKSAEFGAGAALGSASATAGVFRYSALADDLGRGLSGASRVVNDVPLAYHQQLNVTKKSLAKFNAASRVSQRIGVVGGIVSGSDYAYNMREGNYHAAAWNGTDLLMTTVSFIPPKGTAIGLAYFTGRFAVDYNRRD